MASKTRLAHPSELQTLIAIDNAASRLYTDAGLPLEIEEDHPLVLAEIARWADAIEQGRVFVTTDPLDKPLGFITMSIVDNAPYLDQISVHPNHMRKGLGTLLIDQAFLWSGDKPIWLTTYSHLSWNKPLYEKFGFVEVPEDKCGVQIREILDNQRTLLPAPEKRIAMARLPK